MAAQFLAWLPLILLAGFVGCQNSLSVQPDEAAAVAAIQKLGGKVEFAGEGTDRRVFKVYLHSTKVTDDDLAALEKLPKLRNVFLGKTQIGDAGLAHLEQATGLETLSLNSTRITDAGLKSLAGLKRLKTLNLQETQVTPAGAAQLRKTIPDVKIAR